MINFAISIMCGSRYITSQKPSFSRIIQVFCAAFETGTVFNFTPVLMICDEILNVVGNVLQNIGVCICSKLEICGLLF